MRDPPLRAVGYPSNEARMVTPAKCTVYHAKRGRECKTAESCVRVCGDRRSSTSSKGEVQQVRRHRPCACRVYSFFAWALAMRALRDFDYVCGYLVIGFISDRYAIVDWIGGDLTIRTNVQIY